VHGSHNLAGDMTCPDLGAGSMYGTDPLLGEMTAESPTALVYRPLPNSPAIDTGREMVFEGGSTHDQVGTARPVDGDGDGVAGYDIGSIEVRAYPFTDLSQSPFRVEIRWLWEEGITLGCGGTRFCPTAPVTREQMASFLVRALDLPATANDYFVDDEASGHEADINALRAAGITNGCGTDPVVASPTFGSPIYCPTAAVTRAEMASFLARAFPLPAAAVDYFDDDDGNVFHENDINTIAQAGITLGCGGRNYCPGNPVLREQMAAFLYRGLTD
jgi:S-layer homology domain